VEFYAHAEFIAIIGQHKRLVPITGVWHIKKRTYEYSCVSGPRQVSNETWNFIDDLLAELREKSQIPVSSQATAFTIGTGQTDGELVV